MSHTPSKPELLRDVVKHLDIKAADPKTAPSLK